MRANLVAFPLILTRHRTNWPSYSPLFSPIRGRHLISHLSLSLPLSDMKKVVLQVDLHDDKEKKKAMKAVSSISGIDSITMDMKDRKLTVVGEVDPVDVVNKLRKRWHTSILLVGPAVEPQKKKEEPPKKPEPEKKKEEPKKAEPEKKKDPNDQVAELVKAYQAYNPHMTTHYYAYSAEENPNSCAIC